MKVEALLEKLESAAVALAVRVSYEAIGATVSSGGLCRVKGQYRVIIDKRTVASERVAVLAQSLAALAAIDSDGVELEPVVREALEYYSLRRAS